MLFVCAGYYGRIAWIYGTPLVSNWDPVVGFSWWQDPGYRTSASFLRFGANNETLDWAVAPFSGGTVPTYDLLRAGSPTGFDSALCLETDISSNTATDAGVPSLDEIFYYLVRAENDCGSGSLGLQSSGVPRIGTSCP